MFRAALTACTLIASLAATGCELLDFGQEPTSRVQLMVTHHATPENGQFPDRTTTLGNREFDNDEGWTVTLVEAYVVTTSVSLQECDGNERDLEAYWGQLPENLGNTDLDLFTYGGIEVKASEFCSASVTYGPYTPTPESARMHEMPKTEGVLEGATFYLQGYATRGDEIVEFALSSSEPIVVDVSIDGGPLRVTGDEAFPVELTLSKTYDRLFDGIDFADMPQEDIEANVLAVLGAETSLVAGTAISTQ